MAHADRWPVLHYESWRETCTTPQSVADFKDATMRMLRDGGVTAPIHDMPCEIEGAMTFAHDCAPLHRATAPGGANAAGSRRPRVSTRTRSRLPAPEL